MAVIWGVPYLFIKVADRGLHPAVIVSGRTLIGALVLLPLAARAHAIRPLLGHWRWLVAFAVIEMAVPWYLLTDAERHLSSSLAGLLLASVPLVGALFAVVGGHDDPLTRTRVLGLGLGVAGVVALLGVDLDLGGAGAWPVVEVLLVAVCYATGPVILSRRLAGLPGIGVSALSLAVAAAIYVVPGILQWPTSAPAGVRDLVGGRARPGVHGARLRPVLRPHRRDRPHPLDGHHVPEPGGGAAAGDRRAR